MAKLPGRAVQAKQVIISILTDADEEIQILVQPDEQSFAFPVAINYATAAHGVVSVECRSIGSVVFDTEYLGPLEPEGKDS